MASRFDGMKNIGPGLYVSKDQALHIDVAALLRLHGYADTKENRDMLISVAREMFPKHGCTRLEIVEDL